MLTITRNLNVYSSGIPQIINLSQYDSDFQLVFNLYTSQGALTIPSGTTAEIQGTKKSGTGYSAAAALAGNTVTVTGDNQMTACAGANVFEISLKNNGKVLNTVNFILVVERAALDGDTIQDETVLKELQAIIDSVEDAEQAATDARDAATRAENAARTLTIDSTLTQSGQAADARVTGLRLDAAEEAVDDVKADLEDNFGLVRISDFVPRKYINTNVSVGSAVDLTEQSSNGYSYKIVECSAGDTILINGRGGSNPRLWAFLDDSYNLISKSASALTGNNLIITAPANTSYCIINSETSALGDCCFTPNWYGVTNAIISNSHLIRSSALPSGADLNDYTTPGNYYASTTAIAKSLQNRPSDSSGRLTVMTLNSNSNIFQTYTNVKAEVFTREKDSNGWSEWARNIVDADLSTVNNEIDTLKGALISNQYNVLSDSIPSGADLNDYTTPGNYYVSTTAIARSLINAPMYIGGDLANSSGRLIVMSTMSASSLLQIYINAKGEIFTRRRDSVYWSYWEKKASESDTGVYATKGAYNAMQALIAQSDYNIAFANAYTPLALKNYLGNTQNVHPKVLYFENGFGGHKFWMAYTPYPYSDDIHENPCVAYSDDGYTWKNISGNPLDTAEAPNYNSDGHLVYIPDTGVLELWYRYFERETEVKTIYRMTSTDGVTWSARELIKTFSASEDCASPAIIWDGTNYLLWGISAGTTVNFYTISPSNMSEWTLVRTINTPYYDNGVRVYPWHIDVIMDGNTYVILAMCRNTRNVSDGVWSLFITTSSDNITYNTPVKVVGGADSWDKYMYRSSIVKVGAKYRIYYSACNTTSISSIYNNSHWGIGITESDTLLTGYIGKYE